MAYTIYYDIITDEKLLELGSGKPREIIIPGMLFGVNSKREPLLMSLLRSGFLSQKEYDEEMVGYKESEYDKTRVDILECYGYWDLDNFTVDQLEKYLELYTERLRPRLRPDKLRVMEAKMDELKKYLIQNFSHLTHYTGESSFNEEDNTLTDGSLVFADTTSDPPTFLYFEFGLTGYTEMPPKKMMESDQQPMRLQEVEACGCYSRPEDDYSTELSDSMKSLRLDNEIMAA